MLFEERKFTNLVSPYDVRDYKLVCTASATAFPDTFECKSVTVKDQGYTGSCVAHACSSIVEYHNNRQQDDDTVFSTEFIYGYRPAGYYVGEGMYLRDALKTLRKIGDVPQSDLSGNHEYEEAMENVEANFDRLKDTAHPNRISTYMRVHSENDIKLALMKYGPVIVSMPWHINYSLVDNVYTFKGTSIAGYHCVFIYGWNEKGWLVHNSWGSYWGNNGKFIVPFTFKWEEAWTITDSIVNDDDIVKPMDKWYIRVFNKIINFFSRLFNKH